LEATASPVDEPGVPAPRIEPVAICIDPGGYALIALRGNASQDAPRPLLNVALMRAQA